MSSLVSFLRPAISGFRRFRGKLAEFRHAGPVDNSCEQVYTRTRRLAR